MFKKNNNAAKNYDRAMLETVEELRERGERPGLLLHVCCAPCSSYCLEVLREDFDVTVFYYNPNITEYEEYSRRKAEEQRLIEEYNRQVREGDFAGMNTTAGAGLIEVLEAQYDPDRFFAAAEGYEDCPEGGERCIRCFRERLGVTAETAADHGFPFYTTTLTISPQKDAGLLNRIGQELGEEYGVRFLPSDFKKRNGYKRSVELSARYGLYRQNYCGCIYSRRNNGSSS